MIFNTTKKLITVLAALVIASSASAKTTTAASVVMRPTSEVVAPMITLREIATITSSDKTIAEKIGDISLGYSPLPRKSRTVNRDHIIAAIRRNGYTTNDIELISPKEVSIIRASAVVTGQDLFDTAKAHVIESHQWNAVVEVESVRTLSELIVPKGQMELRVKSDNTKLRKGRNTIAVEVVIDCAVSTTIYVPVQIRLFADVLVATASIAKASTVSASNTTFKTVEITSMPEDIICDGLDNTFEASQQIASGTVIRRSWISEPAAVRSGDSVMVLVSSGSVRISEKGTAAADGRPGERIRVMLSGNRQVSAIVTGPGLVEITIAGRN